MVEITARPNIAELTRQLALPPGSFALQAGSRAPATLEIEIFDKQLARNVQSALMSAGIGHKTYWNYMPDLKEVSRTQDKPAHYKVTLEGISEERIRHLLEIPGSAQNIVQAKATIGSALQENDLMRTRFEADKQAQSEAIAAQKAEKMRGTIALRDSTVEALRDKKIPVGIVQAAENDGNIIITASSLRDAESLRRHIDNKLKGAGHIAKVLPAADADGKYRIEIDAHMLYKKRDDYRGSQIESHKTGAWIANAVIEHSALLTANALEAQPRVDALSQTAGGLPIQRIDHIYQTEVPLAQAEDLVQTLNSSFRKGVATLAKPADDKTTRRVIIDEDLLPAPENYTAIQVAALRDFAARKQTTDLAAVAEKIETQLAKAETSAKEAREAADTIKALLAKAEEDKQAKENALAPLEKAYKDAQKNDTQENTKNKQAAEALRRAYGDRDKLQEKLDTELSAPREVEPDTYLPLRSQLDAAEKGIETAGEAADKAEAKAEQAKNGAMKLRDDAEKVRNEAIKTFDAVEKNAKEAEQRAAAAEAELKKATEAKKAADDAKTPKDAAAQLNVVRNAANAADAASTLAVNAQKNAIKAAGTLSATITGGITMAEPTTPAAPSEGTNPPAGTGTPPAKAEPKAAEPAKAEPKAAEPKADAPAGSPAPEAPGGSRVFAEFLESSAITGQAGLFKWAPDASGVLVAQGKTYTKDEADKLASDLNTRAGLDSKAGFSPQAGTDATKFSVAIDRKHLEARAGKQIIAADTAIDAENIAVLAASPATQKHGITWDVTVNKKGARVYVPTDEDGALEGNKLNAFMDDFNATHGFDGERGPGGLSAEEVLIGRDKQTATTATITPHTLSSYAGEQIKKTTPSTGKPHEGTIADVGGGDEHKANALGDNATGLAVGLGGLMFMMLAGVNPILALVLALVMALVGSFMGDKHGFVNGFVGGMENNPVAGPVPMLVIDKDGKSTPTTSILLDANGNRIKEDSPEKAAYRLNGTVEPGAKEGEWVFKHSSIQPVIEGKNGVEMKTDGATLKLSVAIKDGKPLKDDKGNTTYYLDPAIKLKGMVTKAQEAFDKLPQTFAEFDTSEKKGTLDADEAKRILARYDSNKDSKVSQEDALTKAQKEELGAIFAANKEVMEITESSTLVLPPKPTETDKGAHK